jgi:anaerobic magnesium-protoporphyrin IX monomethyl ester cyclase
MADILLANSYFLKHDPKEYRSMNLYAPLGTLYAAACLKQKGYDVALFDTMLADSEEELREPLRKHKPKIFVIYDDVFNYLTKMCLLRMRQAAFRMSGIAKEYGCTVVVCGSDAADHRQKYFRHNADYIIRGEGEITLGELADFLFCQNGFKQPSLSPFTKGELSIEGLSFIHNGEIKDTAKRDVLKNLDVLPFPAWELVDVNRYRELWKKHHGYFSMNIVTTRGCPFHCNWCAKPIYGQVYNSRSPENVAAEMQMLKEKYSPHHIWFCDDIFGLKPGWVKSFSEAVNRNGVKIPYKIQSRVDLLLKEDNIEHLANSGCESVWLGAESGSQKILDAMEKGTTVEQIYRSRKLLKKKNIKTCFFLQFGYTGETEKEIDMTLRMVKDLMPDDIGISVSYPLPGTKFYDRVASQMGEKKNWVDSQDFEMMFDGEYSTYFYRLLHKKVHKEFRTRQILHEPIRYMRRWWKLPYYVAGWFLFAALMKSKMKNRKSKTQIKNQKQILATTNPAGTNSLVNLYNN